MHFRYVLVWWWQWVKLSTMLAYFWLCSAVLNWDKFSHLLSCFQTCFAQQPMSPKSICVSGTETVHLTKTPKNITQRRILLSSAVYLRLYQAALLMQWPKSFPWILNAAFPEIWWVHYCFHTFRQNEATGIVWKKNLIPTKFNILGLQPQSYIHLCHTQFSEFEILHFY